MQGEELLVIGKMGNGTRIFKIVVVFIVAGFRK